MAFDGYHTNFFSIEKVALTCLKQRGQGHASKAYEREVAKPLNILPYGFSSFLNYREAFIHGCLRVILIESRNKSDFQVNLRINEAIRKALKLIKGYPLKGADEKSGHDSVIIYHVASLRLKVIDMLIR